MRPERTTLTINIAASTMAHEGNPFASAPTPYTVWVRRLTFPSMVEDANRVQQRAAPRSRWFS